jgi:hypothetical protein
MKKKENPMGRLERKLDMSLVRRIKTRPDGTVYIPRAESSKALHKVKPPRQGKSYRGARRNDDREKGWPTATFAKTRPPAKSRGVPLNRSPSLPRAKTYAEAREISGGKSKAA